MVRGPAKKKNAKSKKNKARKQKKSNDQLEILGTEIQVPGRPNQTHYCQRLESEHRYNFSMKGWVAITQINSLLDLVRYIRNNKILTTTLR